MGLGNELISIALSDIRAKHLGTLAVKYPYVPFKYAEKY
jgi:hypothetical protein